MLDDSTGKERDGWYDARWDATRCVCIRARADLRVPTVNDRLRSRGSDETERAGVGARDGGKERSRAILNRDR